MTDEAKKEPQQEMVTLDEAKRKVRAVCLMLGQLHLAFARTIVNELGEKEGKKLILKAIKDYGARGGERAKAEVLAQGKKNTPENRIRRPMPYGMHDRIPEWVEVEGETRNQAFGCVMAKVWHEAGEDELGRLFCFCDTASYMAYNPDYKFVHLKALPDGDPYCELVVRPTTEQERKDFATGEDWEYIDRPKK